VYDVRVSTKVGFGGGGVIGVMVGVDAAVWVGKACHDIDG
jgi:hypothetical protein